MIYIYIYIYIYTYHNHSISDVVLISPLDDDCNATIKYRERQVLCHLSSSTPIRVTASTASTAVVAILGAPIGILLYTCFKYLDTRDWELGASA